MKETWNLPQPLTIEKEIKDEEKSDGQEIRNSLGSVLTANMDDTGTYSRVPNKHLAFLFYFRKCFTRDTNKKSLYVFFFNLTNSKKFPPTYPFI